MSEKKSLLLRFSFLSLAFLSLAFLVFGFALGKIITSSLEENVIRRSKTEIVQFVADEIDKVFPGMDFSLPMTGPRYEDFQKEVSHLKFNPSIKRIKVWNLDRVIVWSDERQLVGKQFPDNKELQEALNGTVISKFTSPSKPESKTEHDYPRLLELYIPIRSEHEGRIKAVFEIYQDFESLDVEISRQKRTLWIAIFAGLLGIYFACFGIVFRDSRQLRKQSLEINKSEEKSHALVQDLTSLANNVPGIIYRGYPDWSLSFIGAEVAAVTGYTSDELIRGTVQWKEIIFPDDLEMVKESFRKATREKWGQLRVEYRIRHKDGGIRWIADRRQLIYDEKGVFTHVDGLLLDVTEGKRAEEALARVTLRMELILNSAGEGIYGVDLEGRTTFINPRAVRMVGWQADELLGKLQHDVLHHTKPDGTPYPREECPICAAFKDGVVRHGDNEVFWRKDGTSFPLDYISTPMRNERGELVGAVVTFRDITERKEAEVLLRENEEKFRSIYEGSNDAIMLLTDKGYFDCNARTLEIFGLKSKDEFVHMHPSQLSPPSQPDGRDSFSAANEKIATAFKQGASRFDWIYRRKSGEDFDAEVLLSSFGYKGEKILQATVRDISAQRRLEYLYRQSQKMEAVGRLAGGIAHDFNNLLTAVEGYSDLLLSRLGEDNPLSADVREIRKAGERASALTRQLLAFSRMQVLQPKVLDLNELVENIKKMLGRLIEENIELVTVPGENLGKVKMDKGQMEQVLLNLAINSRDAMPDGGRITVETSNVSLDDSFLTKSMAVRPGPYVMLTVTDTGSGMSEETMSHIFEPFYTTKELGKGTGLGLATVYGIIKQSNGYIWAYSEPGHGATFKIYLPRVDEEAEEAAEAPRPLVPARAAGTETVLVVEDTDLVRALVKEVLTRSGYTVLEATNGEDAMHLYRQHEETIHLLLTDMMMPKMSGAELARTISSYQPGIKVLYMSGYTEYGSADNVGLPSGSFFIQKPFSVADLTKKVREVLGELSTPA